MADALCGPSNALQNFQKHSTVDRTLQQDRLISRHDVSQGFRSSPAPGVGVDSEFDAFQAGRPGPPPQEFFQPRPQFALPPPQQHYAQPQVAPDWAADFQRLSINNSPAPSLQRQAPQAVNAASWHQDFMSQQAPAQAPALQQNNAFGGMQGYNMGYAAPTFMQTPGFQNTSVSEVAQGKQPMQEAVPAFDEAAFEQAFLQAEAQAEQDILAEQRAETTQSNLGFMDYSRPGELDPLLMRIRETRPAVYSAIQVWSETGLGRSEEAVAYLDNMTQLEENGQLVEDANEAKWIVDSLQRIADRDAPQEVKTRADSLIKAINERIMSQYPLGAKVPMSEEKIWEELEQAGYMRTPELERTQQPAEQEKPQTNNDDEMAATAGLLLEKVADNTSEKFQNSQFFELMRRLRDHEVRVDDDKIVEVAEKGSTSTTQQGTSQGASAPSASASQIPDVDSRILDHAATDFEMPVYSDFQEQST